MKDEIAIRLKEYESIRLEIINSEVHRNQIVGFTLATFSVLLAGIFFKDLTNSPLIVVLVFCIGLPIFSLLVLYLWIGQMDRTIRAARYLHQFEQDISRAIDSPNMVLNWEHWLRNEKPKRYPHIAVVALYFGAIFGSPVLGGIVGGLNIFEAPALVLIPWSIALLPLIHVCYLGFCIKNSYQLKVKLVNPIGFNQQNKYRANTQEVAATNNYRLNKRQ